MVARAALASLTAGATVAVAAGTAACGSAPRVRFDRMAAPDLAIDLADAGDRDYARDALRAMDVGAPGRTEARAALARAAIGRVDGAVAAGKYRDATGELYALGELWQRDPTALADELAWAVPSLQAAADAMSTHGADHGALAARVLLQATDGANAAAHGAEIAEILAYLDDLGVGEMGPAGSGQLAVAALEPLARALPLPTLVDDVIARIAARQAAFTAILQAGGASVDLVRAHSDIFTSARRAAGLLALSGRAAELETVLAGFRGLGSATALTRALEATRGREDAWLDVAVALAGVDEDGAADDADAGLALLAQLPRAVTARPAFQLARGQLARAAGRPQTALAAYDALLADDPTNLVGLTSMVELRSQWIEWLLGRERPGAAAAQRATVAAALAHPALREVPPERVAALAARVDLAWGRGQLGQGLLDDASAAISASLASAPSHAGSLAAGELALGRGRPGVAYAHFLNALAQTGAAPERGYAARLAGDAAALDGDTSAATRQWIDALSTWAAVGQDGDELEREQEATRLLESARCLWSLGETDKAFELVARATGVAPDDAGRITDAVRFLLEVDAPLDAAEAFEQLLGSPTATADDKTALALWLVADARQRHAVPAARIQAWLAGRSADANANTSWLDRLAQASTGAGAWSALTPSTPRQQMQLTYYRALLDDPVGSPSARHRLQEVVASEYVLTHEFDDARARLRERR